MDFIRRRATRLLSCLSTAILDAPGFILQARPMSRIQPPSPTARSLDQWTGDGSRVHLTAMSPSTTRICKLFTILIYNNTLHPSTNRDCETEATKQKPLSLVALEIAISLTKPPASFLV